MFCDTKGWAWLQTWKVSLKESLPPCWSPRNWCVLCLLREEVSVPITITSSQVSKLSSFRFGQTEEILIETLHAHNSATLWAVQSQEKDYQHVAKDAQHDRPLPWVSPFKLKTEVPSPFRCQWRSSWRYCYYVTLQALIALDLACQHLNNLVYLCRKPQQLVENIPIAVV